MAKPVKKKPEANGQALRRSAMFHKGQWHGEGMAWLKERSQIRVAQLLGCSKTTILRWESLYGLPRHDYGYDLGEIVQWYAKFMADQGPAQTPDRTGQHFDKLQQKLDEEIRQKRLKTDILQKAVLPRDEVESAHREWVSVIVSRLEELPAAVAAAVPPDIALQVKAVVEEAIIAARKDLAGASVT